MTDKRKINWLLILQGWAMLLVVIGHAFIGKSDEWPIYVNVLFRFAYSFHMPLFMLISGWLFYLTRLKISVLSCGRGGVDCSIIYDKALRLLLPGVFFSIVAFVIKVALPGEMSRQPELGIKGIIHSFLYPNDNPFRELWFIVTLFWYFMLTPLWRLVIDRNWLMWLTLFLLMVLHFVHPSTEMLCINRVFSYAVWFYLGLIVSKKEYIDRFASIYPFLIFAVGIVIYVLGMYVNTSVTALGGIVFSFGFALIANRYIPGLFASFRNYTYQIFLLGIFAQMFVKILYRHVAMPYWAAYIMCVLAGVYVPLLVSKMVEITQCNSLQLCFGLKPRKK